nr:hypothetical protein [Heyndrickxia coagulans]
MHNNVLNVYVGTASGKMMIEPNGNLPAGYDPRQRPWYKEAMEQPGKAIVTAPYQGRDHGGNDYHHCQNDARQLRGCRS